MNQYLISEYDYNITRTVYADDYFINDNNELEFINGTDMYGDKNKIISHWEFIAKVMHTNEIKTKLPPFDISKYL